MPEDVSSPKEHWRLIKVLDEVNNADKCALAIGRWDNAPVLVIRTNGDEENPLGNPQSRGLPTWFRVPTKYTESILAGANLPADKLFIARQILDESK